MGMKRFTTEYQKDDGHTYTGWVDALDIEHAQMICDSRPLGERVLGVIYTVVSDPNWTDGDADQFLEAMAMDRPDDEPPDAEEFDSVDMGRYDEELGDYVYSE